MVCTPPITEIELGKTVVIFVLFKAFNESDADKLIGIV